MKTYIITTYTPATATGNPDAVHNQTPVSATSTADALDKVYILPLPVGVRVAAYPAVTDAKDGDGIMDLAAYVQRAERRWRIRNGYAVNAALSESPWDMEDARGDAYAAILQHMADDPEWTIHSCYRAGFAAVTTKRRALYRKSEIEYLPGWDLCNPDLSAAVRDRLTIPAALVDMVDAAVDAAALTVPQRTVIDGIMAGIAPAELCRIHGMSKDAYKGHKRPALAKVAAALVTMDGFGNAMRRAGWTASDEDLTAAAAALVERAAAVRRAQNRSRRKSIAAK